jgi:hypothetical protein
LFAEVGDGPAPEQHLHSDAGQWQGLPTGCRLGLIDRRRAILAPSQRVLGSGVDEIARIQQESDMDAAATLTHTYPLTEENP